MNQLADGAFTSVEGRSCIKAPTFIDSWANIRPDRTNARTFLDSGFFYYSTP